jgi:uncharacterized protein
VRTPIRLEATPDGRACLLSVRAQPGARRRGAAGSWNGMLKVAVTSPAQDGRANEDLARTVAEIFGLRRSSVRLVSGERSREKRFRLEASASKVSAMLEGILA